MKNNLKHITKMMVAAGAVTFGLTGLAATANASTVYHRTSIKNVKSTAMYSTSNKGKTYSFKGSAVHFTLKSSHNLKSYHNSTWTKAKQTTIKHGRHSSTYYYVKNAKNGASGWVNKLYMKTGRDYQLSNPKNVTSKDYIMKSNGKVYQLKGNNNWFQFKSGQSLSDTATYAVTAQRNVYKKGKASIYYYVVGTDGTKGWTWHGYLTAGDHKSATQNNITSSTGNSGQAADSDGFIHVDNASEVGSKGPGVYTYTENANDSWTKSGNEWSDKVKKAIDSYDIENKTAAQIESDYSGTINAWG
ncbi:hypothetical protein IWT5_01075 [Secundilactobacillus silagincola]|uniref:S-layer protein n=1 Tax=Secundilactobacillus silagincola TaxID=1714681 RepID=A0A1Z5J1J5_9LACO|nr:hypothetical protein [Secundilactobacillus silagincola]GAX07924.1 hypothetical protein IWT5_01075 [Secundilactobacillus silagincola]